MKKRVIMIAVLAMVAVLLSACTLPNLLSVLTTTREVEKAAPTNTPMPMMDVEVEALDGYPYEMDGVAFAAMQPSSAAAAIKAPVLSE